VLLGLNEDRFLDALGIAGTSACGLLSRVDDPSEQPPPLLSPGAAQPGPSVDLRDVGGGVELLAKVPVVQYELIVQESVGQDGTITGRS
jgi:hypothetical protein